MIILTVAPCNESVALAKIAQEHAKKGEMPTIPVEKSVEFEDMDKKIKEVCRRIGEGA